MDEPKKTNITTIAGKMFGACVSLFSEMYEIMYKQELKELKQSQSKCKD